MMTESELIEHATHLIENYFQDDMPYLLKIDWEQAHAEVAKWMAIEFPDDQVPATWEFRIAYEMLRESEKK